MKAKFIGDPSLDGDGPKVLVVFGRRFPKDQFVTLAKVGEETDADFQRVVSKLSNNDHFEVGEGDGVAVAEEAKPDPLDHDRSGKKGGSRKKTDIVADLKALAEQYPGQVEFDETLSGPKLAEHLEELKFLLGED